MEKEADLTSALAEREMQIRLERFLAILLKADYAYLSELLEKNKSTKKTSKNKV